MRLFRRTNSIRRTLEAQDAAAASGIDLETGLEASINDASIVHPDIVEVHGDLDQIELRLAEIRERQSALIGEESTTSRKGRVVQLDIRDLIDLADDNDEDFDKRFHEFASSNNDDHTRRWMEG